jgi:hypothetical protein
VDVDWAWVMFTVSESLKVACTFSRVMTPAERVWACSGDISTSSTSELSRDELVGRAWYGGMYQYMSVLRNDSSSWHKDAQHFPYPTFYAAT